MRMRSCVFFSLLFATATALAADANVSVGGTSMGGYYGGGSPMLMFSPSTVTIDAGDRVTFTNAGGGYHNVVADDGSFRCAQGCDGDGAGGSGTPSMDSWSATVRFNQAGTFNYHCQNHGPMGMTGKVIVRPKSVSLASGLSGAWYNASQSGHGFLLEALPNNVMLVIWFVYSPDGSKQNWVLAQGSYDPALTSVTLPASLFENGRFPPNFNPAAVTNTPWGTLTLSFSDCSNGTATWNSTLPGYGSGSLAITRLASIAGTTCP